MDRAALSPSVKTVPASRIREIADIAFSMDGVLKLYFGESDQPTPDYIKEAATRALADGYTFYTENAGLPSLRKALAEKYRELHRVELDPGSEIVITSSGVQALNVGIRCALDPGDEALLLTPAWPNGSAIVQMFNARPRQVPMALRGSRYEIDFDRAHILPDSTDPASPLHLAFQPIGMGGLPSGPGGAAGILPPSPLVAAGRRSLRTPLLRRKRRPVHFALV